MKGKLKTLEEIRKDRKVKDSLGGIYVFHSTVKLNIDINEKNFKKFGTVIDVEIWKEESNRVIYYDGVSKEKYDQLYYDEWFEWIHDIGLDHIPEELWNIEDL